MSIRGVAEGNSEVYTAVYELLSQIPKGKISTYADVAKALGDVRAARAVGKILSENPEPGKVPCHRVIHSNSELGGYKLGIDKKIEFLEKEGIKIKDNRIENFSSVLFRDFKSEYSLKKLIMLQENLKSKVVLEDRFEKIDFIAGVDAVYENNLGWCACALFDYKTKSVIEKAVIKEKVDFPYIPTYLFFREFPLIKQVLSLLKNKPAVLIVDGNGILHPRGMGIASQTGIMLDMPTIGIAKSLLCGKIQFVPQERGKYSKIFYRNKHVGFCLKSSMNAEPIYISPGHKVSLDSSVKIVKEFCKFRIPEPIRIADMLAKKAKKVI